MILLVCTLNCPIRKRCGHNLTVFTPATAIFGNKNDCLTASVFAVLFVRCVISSNSFRGNLCSLRASKRSAFQRIVVIHSYKLCHRNDLYYTARIWLKAVWLMSEYCSDNNWSITSTLSAASAISLRQIVWQVASARTVQSAQEVKKAVLLSRTAWVSFRM